MHQFGDVVNSFVDAQFALMNFVSIGIQGYLTKVHQLHLSKNSYIKPHIEKYDMDASIIVQYGLQKEILQDNVLEYINNV